MQPVSLKQYIDDLRQQSPVSAVPAMATLVTGLKTSVSYTGERLITHDGFEGSASLNAFARLYLANGECPPRTPLETRLQHHALHTTIEELFVQSNAAVAATWGAQIGTLCREFTLGCACCSGIPVYQIGSRMYKKEAFYFPVDEFESLWPDAEFHGSSYSYDPLTRVGTERRLATREMVEEAAQRG